MKVSTFSSKKIYKGWLSSFTEVRKRIDKNHITKRVDKNVPQQWLLFVNRFKKMFEGLFVSKQYCNTKNNLLYIKIFNTTLNKNVYLVSQVALNMFWSLVCLAVSMAEFAIVPWEGNKSW